VHSSQSWREQLGKITKNSQERARIANELGISPITLIRWVSGASKPRPQNLRLLLNILPGYRHQFLELFLEEFGPSFAVTIADDTFYEIPASLYARVMHAHCTLPRILHCSSICDLVLQEALSQLDPRLAGMHIAIVQCIHPGQDNRVRSLRESVGYGTPPWKLREEQKNLLLGAESFAGFIVSGGQLSTVRRRQQDVSSFVPQWEEWEESKLGCPIVLGDRIAGCLLVSSTQPDYFLPPDRQRLIQCYAELITVAFEPGDFYERERIELGYMPSHDVQRSYQLSLRRRIADTILHSRLSIPYVEHQLLLQVEEELLQQRTY